MSQNSNRDAENEASSGETGITRRTLLTTAAAGLGTAMVGGSIEAIADETNSQERRLVSELGERSPFENPRRVVRTVLPSSASKTPLQDLTGFITPSDLHYERHHTGIPSVDPDAYALRIEGLVDRPVTLTLSDLKRLPERSDIRYMECGSNGVRAFAGMVPEMTPADFDGMVSTSQWTGTAFSSLLELVGPRPEATWFEVEGYDGDWVGSVPMDSRWDDSLIAWGQNGEALRPEQGYPVRLLLKGHPGGPNIKWLNRIEFKADPIPEATVRAFSSRFGSKSVITYPAYPNVLAEPGELVISGLAWSGRGKIAQVDISTDGGRTWAAAELQNPVLPQCQTRFQFTWNWDGGDALLMSRATDETGDVQPSLEEARHARETQRDLRHYNTNIRAWAVAADGVVTFGLS